MALQHHQNHHTIRMDGTSSKIHNMLQHSSLLRVSNNPTETAHERTLQATLFWNGSGDPHQHVARVLQDALQAWEPFSELLSAMLCIIQPQVLWTLPSNKRHTTASITHPIGTWGMQLHLSFSCAWPTCCCMHALAAGPLVTCGKLRCSCISASPVHGQPVVVCMHSQHANQSHGAT
jgi:hypothetical protein